MILTRCGTRTEKHYLFCEVPLLLVCIGFTIEYLFDYKEWSWEVETYTPSLIISFLDLLLQMYDIYLALCTSICIIVYFTCITDANPQGGEGGGSVGAAVGGVITAFIVVAVLLVLVIAGLWWWRKR